MLLSILTLNLGWLRTSLGCLSPESPTGALPRSVHDVNGGCGRLVGG